jgi:hypothetical protein
MRDHGFWSSVRGGSPFGRRVRPGYGDSLGERMAGMAEPDELTLMIARVLEVDWQYFELVEAWNVDRIAEVRAAGRRAGRLLGYKVLTRQSSPRREDGRVVVAVVVREPPNDVEAERMRERAKLLIDSLWPTTPAADPNAGGNPGRLDALAGAPCGRTLAVGMNLRSLDPQHR